MLDDKLIGVQGDLAKIILGILKDFDYKNVDKKYLNRRYAEKRNESLLGVTDPNKKIIYVARDQSDVEREITQLHEFAHCYLFGIGIPDLPEDEVDNIAYRWRRKMYEGLR